MRDTGIQRIQRIGRKAVLVDVASSAHARALGAYLKTNPAPGQVDLVAAERTVLVVLDRGGRQPDAAQHITDAQTTLLGDREGRVVDIPTYYDGADLGTVAEALGTDVAGVIEAHSSQLWLAEFNGFAPGFVYMTGENERLSMPRRSTPRKAVPAGSVAIADRFSAIYPRTSPGGWQLLGHTEAVMWDSSRTFPALVSPGDYVRFVPVEGTPSPRRRQHKNVPASTAVEPVLSGLVVVEPGLQTLIQDLGRPGQRERSVAPSGAADVASYLIGNELVGNERGAASLEIVFGRALVEARGDQVLALTGASVTAEITSEHEDPRSVDGWGPFVLRDGERLRLGASTAGVRAYLSVRGGFDTPVELGSRSTDVLSGIGVPVVKAGDVLPVGPSPAHPVELNADPLHMPLPDETVDVVIDFGSRADLFSEQSKNALFDTVWTITPDSNRIGIRMRGDAQLAMIEPHELPSEGILAGAIQVPPSGQPVVFLRDHPITGGYPLIGIVREDSLNDLAQLTSGNKVRFVLGEQK
ncbi:5-oxoprolinase/urea amidolyase family protein [soil metagenome]